MASPQARTLEVIAGCRKLIFQGEHRVFVALQDAEVGVAVPRNQLSFAYRPQQGPVVQPVDDAVARQQVAGEADQLEQVLGAAGRPERTRAPVHPVALTSVLRARRT